jgi:hypothetical protein
MLTDLERELLQFALAGDDVVLEGLRRQLISATSERREFTGEGFVTDIGLPDAAAPVASGTTFVIDDLFAQLSGYPSGGIALVSVDHGRLSQLEYWGAIGEWPSDPTWVSLEYLAPTRLGPAQPLTLVPERDLEALRQHWGAI